MGGRLLGNPDVQYIICTIYSITSECASSYQVSEFCCQASIGLLHVHNLSVGSQDVEFPDPGNDVKSEEM